MNTTQKYTPEWFAAYQAQYDADIAYARKMMAQKTEVAQTNQTIYLDAKPEVVTSHKTCEDGFARVQFSSVDEFKKNVFRIPPPPVR